MLGPLLPPGVHLAESWNSPVIHSPFPDEEQLVARARADRRRQFLTGRSLARDALAALGHPPTAIGRDVRGAPLWPQGVVGSVTHTDRYAAVTLADHRTCSALGIDAEPLAPLPDDARDVVATPEEVRELTAVAGEHAGLLAFVAKEAVFKAWWPREQTELDFLEVVLASETEPAHQGTLRAEIATPRLQWQVRWRIAQDHLLAAVVVPAQG